MSANLAELIPRLGAEAVGVLAAWAQLNARTVRVPTRPWGRQGYTDARLAQVFITEAGVGTQLVVVKVLPSGQAMEPATHRRVLQEAPPAFRNHLVQLAYDPVPVGRDMALTFQRVAGDSSDWLQLGELATVDAPAVCQAVVGSLITDWNPDFTVKSVDVVDFLFDEIGEVNAVYQSIERVRAESSPDISIEGGLRSDLLSLTSPTSSLFGRQVDAIFGHVHGDLHDLNVLVEHSDGLVVPDTFMLVDLMTYESSGQLGRDLVRLLLSVIARIVPDLSASERTLLLTAMVRPKARRPRSLPPLAADIIDAIYGGAATLLKRCGQEVWRTQYLLTLFGQALSSTTFDSLTEQHEWLYQLACRAAAELQTHFDPADGRPPVPPTRTSVISSSQTAAALQYSALKRSAVCRGLGADWQDLAVYLRIPPDDLTGPARGRQSFAIWEWLSDHDRLDELAPALRNLGRGDLAQILDGG